MKVKIIKDKHNSAVEILLPNGMKVYVKESEDNPPLGVIVDIVDTTDVCIDSFTHWYSYADRKRRVNP